MPNLTTIIDRRHPDARFIRELKYLLDSLVPGERQWYEVLKNNVTRDKRTWSWDSLDQIIQDLETAGLPDSLVVRVIAHRAGLGNDDVDLMVETGDGFTRVSVEANETVEASDLHARIASRLEQAEVIYPSEDVPRVFIGHGRDGAWTGLRDFLRDKLHVEVRAFESSSRVGYSIRDILSEELGRSNFAFIVMTAEDEQQDGQRRARQNVIHEAGLFQGKLGFDRAVLVVEEGVENFSNVDGLQQIRFGAGNIVEAFGEAAAVLNDRFGV